MSFKQVILSYLIWVIRVRIPTLNLNTQMLDKDLGSIRRKTKLILLITKIGLTFLTTTQHAGK